MYGRGGKGGHRRPLEARTARLTRRGAARVRSGHPWVYRSDVAQASGEPGDVVRVLGPNGAPLGRAFFNPDSEISIRLATYGDEDLDGGWFRDRLSAAIAYRESLDVDATALRLVHAEADGLPGLICDRYDEYLVLQVGSAAVERRLDWILEILHERLEPRGILLRGDSAARKREGLETGVRVLRGDVPESIVVREGPVSYWARPHDGQKTGGFLDQRENHLAAGRYARGRVLDVFSYAGGFALHAARGADSVEAVDSSGPALEMACRNAELNGLSNITFTRENAFDVLRSRSDRGEQYDVVVLDPPAFAKSRREVSRARRAYKEINLRAMRLLAPGGILVTCSCSYHFTREILDETLRSAAADAGASMRVVEWRGQSADHPVLLNVPETHYLKCAILQRA
jgi:23S rRNA (cytosine1962-C5)-methyltransferase